MRGAGRTSWPCGLIRPSSMSRVIIGDAVYCRDGPRLGESAVMPGLCSCLLYNAARQAGHGRAQRGSAGVSRPTSLPRSEVGPLRIRIGRDQANRVNSMGCIHVGDGGMEQSLRRSRPRRRRPAIARPCAIPDCWTQGAPQRADVPMPLLAASCRVALVSLSMAIIVRGPLTCWLETLESVDAARTVSISLFASL